MAKIVKMEDIIQVVGMKHYVEAIEMSLNDLSYMGSEKISSSVVTLKFDYQDSIHMGINVGRDHFIKDIHCTCSSYRRQDYCAHAALMIMYLYQNEDVVERAIETLTSDYDYKFNNLLFQTLGHRNIDKKKVSFDIILKEKDNFCYELSLKIGLDRKYVLKKNLVDFVNNYQELDYECEFGKGFTYSSHEHYVGSEDVVIMKFLQQYLDSQVEFNYGYYGFYQPSTTTILLKNELLCSFLKLLENRSFTVERGYYYERYDGIKSGFPGTSKLKKNNQEVVLELDYDHLEPFTSNYEYIMDNNNIYCLTDDERTLVQVMMENKRKKIIFKESEFSHVSNQILPRLKNIQIEDSLKDVFVFDTGVVRYYFESSKRGIIGYIKICFGDVELDLLDPSNYFNGHYISRNLDDEKKYIDELYRYGFQLEEDHSFLLHTDELIIDFLEMGLSDLGSRYDIYVSRDLKEVRVWKNVGVQNSFGIGRDQILSYQFDVEHIEPDEIVDLLKAVRMKKKFYKLKSGDYLNLDESDDLEKMDRMLKLLDVEDKDLLNNEIVIPKYKSLYLQELATNQEEEFISFNQSLQKLINQFYRYRDEEIYLLEEDKAILRDYQVIGVQWMMMIARCGFGGILADEMGLGKSLQTICYMKLRLQENPNAKFLIVVPTSLVYNWENELNKFGNNLKYAILSDTKINRKQVLEHIDDYQVLITSYGILRQDIDDYKDILFDTCIIDEAQNIKNVNAMVTKSVKMIQADVKFALTGTPIENSILELWSIFDFIMPGFLPRLSHFKSLYSVSNMEADDEWYYELNCQIRPFILRRKKCDVLSDLPSKLENEVIVELTDEQKKVYMAQLEKTKQEIEEMIQTEGFNKSHILILSLLTKLRQICIDPRLILDNYKGVGSKFQQLFSILEELIQNGHKILLFSQFPSALQLIRPELDNRGIKHFYLDGSTKSKLRMDMVDKFNQDDTSVFLISLKAGGTGLNLTSADVVIHLDPWWNPQVENQATDRSHRIGQKNVVNVIKLVTKGTIEEKIIELQNKKKKLSDQVIDGEQRDEIFLSKLTESELKDILISNLY